MDYIFITNDVDTARYAQSCGVDRIMVDLEITGKNERQGHLNTVISNHSLKDVANVRNVLNKSKLLVRVNPIHDNSKDEINEVIRLGADIVMLPMFTTPKEVVEFISHIDGRVTVNLLLETPQALVRINEILSISGINEIHVGLNDLHLGTGLEFMFELLSGGIVEYLSDKINAAGIKFGFGGIARLGQGMLDSSLILSEHYRLNSKMVILSRDFHGGAKNYLELKESIDLKHEVDSINKYMNELNNITNEKLNYNRFQVIDKVRQIVNKNLIS